MKQKFILFILSLIPKWLKIEVFKEVCNVNCTYEEADLANVILARYEYLPEVYPEYTETILMTIPTLSEYLNERSKVSNSHRSGQ
jgi:hypothetical protein